MKKFILCTRGRTGSTAVIDELNRLESLTAAQELFIPYSPEIDEDYPLGFFHQPFNQWKLTKAKWFHSFPYINWEKGLANRYLAEIESNSEKGNKSHFGFKALTYHFNQRKYLSGLLQERDYNDVVFLKRNIFYQVVSGIVANETKLYNRIEKSDKQYSCEIDCEKLKWKLNHSEKQQSLDYEFLVSSGFNVNTVYYEDFVNDRDHFYKKLFDAIGFESVIPPRTNFQKIIKNMSDVIINYDEVKSVAVNAGFDTGEF